MNGIADLFVRVLLAPRQWTWQAIVGALLLAAALIVPRVVYVDPDLVDTLITIGGVLALGAQAVPVPGAKPGVAASATAVVVPPPDQRGRVGVGVLLALAGMALLWAVGGCAGSQYAGRHADVDWTPGPPCHFAVRLDGAAKPVVTVDADEACEPPPVMCPVAPPRPQS